VNYAKRLLSEVGLEPERLEMYFLSSAEGARFAEIAAEMTERARRLGPNPLKPDGHIEQPMEVEE
jgi:coenzyme F420-reducing hydrogenase delta subunit